MSLLSKRFLIVAVALLSINAGVVFAQKTPATVNRSNAPVSKYLNDIESQTDYLFIYRKDVDLSVRKSISYYNCPVSTILDELLADTGVTYSLEGNYIILTSVGSVARRIPVRGLVQDEEGHPLAGVFIMTEGGNSFAVSDSHGLFSIEAENGQTLVFTSLGYAGKKITVSPGQSLRVALEEEFEQLEGTVAIGFGVQKKSDVTGSISSVDGSFLGNRAVNNVVAAISGSASGVQVLSKSGDPGAIGDIRIRGLSTNSSSGSTPLYVVDGLLVSNLKGIDVQNIESIEILKDAASAAIYGAQAGNGAVVITTKTGDTSRGGVFYNGSYSLESLGWKPEMMNAGQYVDFVTASGLATQSTIDENWNGRTDTDWFAEMFPGGYSRRHNVGVQGGGDRAGYYMSMTYLDNDGILYGQKDRLKRTNFQLNASYKIKDWLSVGTTNAIEYKTISAENGSMGGSEKSAMAMVLAMDPLTPLSYPKDALPDYMRSSLESGKPLLSLPNGEYIASSAISSSSINPLLNLYRYSESLNENLFINGTAFVEIKPFSGFSFTSRMGYSLKDCEDYTFEAPWYYDGWNSNTRYQLEESVAWSYRYQWDNFVNYSTIFQDSFTLDAMAGMTYIEENGREIEGSTDSLKSFEPNFRYLDYSTSNANDDIGGMRSRGASLSYFANAGIHYRGRYHAQASFRADAFDTSILSRENRWGYFPSVSLGWTITNETWMRPLVGNVLSFLKLRASWGVNGNVRALSDYQYASSIIIGARQYNLGPDSSLTLASYPSGLANDDLTWEKSKQIDFGVDSRLFDGHLSATLDSYCKLTEDLLVPVTPSYTTGQSSVYLNAGSVLNRGVELEFVWKDSVGGLVYSVGANFSGNENLVTYLDPSITRISGTEINNGHHATYFQMGYPIWYMSGYVYEGVDPDTGNGIFADLNEDGAISQEDMTEIGNAQPDFTYGVNLSLDYKGFDFRMMANGIQGNDIWFATITSTSAKNLPLEFYSKAWRSAGDPAEYPSFRQILTSAYARSSACVYDGSYFRIGQVQVGYSLPAKMIDRVGLSSARFYVSMDDYFTFSRYIGFDPVTASGASGSSCGLDRGTYPSSKKLSIGVNLSF